MVVVDPDASIADFAMLRPRGLDDLALRADAGAVIIGEQILFSILSNFMVQANQDLHIGRLVVEPRVLEPGEAEEQESQAVEHRIQYNPDPLFHVYEALSV